MIHTPSPDPSAQAEHRIADPATATDVDAVATAETPVEGRNDAGIDIQAPAPLIEDDTVVEDEPLQPEWQPLPKRAHTVFRYVSLLTVGIPALIGSALLYRRLGSQSMTWIAIGAILAAATAFGLWLAYRRYRYTFWKLDRDGFAVKRGRLWQWETRVPTTRVQHMDLKRGPFERAHRLASVVLHTAGTRLSSISVSGIDLHDAERLRDYLTRQIDRQDGDDSEHA